MCIHKETSRFYIGYRELNVKLGIPSDQDLPIYKTSSKLVKPFFEEYEWIIVAEFFDPDAAYDFEQKLISFYWGNKLLINKNCMKQGKRFKGKIQHSNESKIKMSTAKSGKNNPMFGKIPYNFGKKKPEFIKDKISDSMKGKKHSAETKTKIKTSLLGKPKEKIKCPFCEKIGGKSPMSRWHFNNCKMKKEP